MKRDFSAFEKYKLLLMVKIVEPDNVFESVRDWFDDMALNYLQQHYNVIGAIKSLGAINTYHLSMIDKDNVSAQKIKEIFANAISVDSDYKTALSQSCNDISYYSDLLKRYYSCISVESKNFCSQTSVRKLRKKIVEEFEEKHPEHKKNMDSFFVPISEEYRDDVENIKYIVYNSKEPYRSLFLDNVGDAKLGKTAPYEEIHEGEIETVSGFAYFRSSDKTINIDFTDNSHLSSDPRGQYATFFHEYGHYLDDRYGEKGFYTDNYVSSDGNKLSDIIDDDVYRVVKSKVKDKYPDYSNERVEQITQRLVKGNLPNYVDNDEESIKNDAIRVQQEFREELKDAKADGPSDTYDGSTNYLRDYTGEDYDLNSSETGKGVAGAYQHGDDYYYKINKKGQLVKQDNCAAKESFATFFSVGIRSDSESRELYEKYLPNTTKEFDIAVDNMRR